MGIGQAAGMAAALCIEQGSQPRDLSVRLVQEALLTDSIAPAAVIPLLNRSPRHSDWLFWQTYYLDKPEAYPSSGNAPTATTQTGNHFQPTKSKPTELALKGYLIEVSNQYYRFQPAESLEKIDDLALVTLIPEVNQSLMTMTLGQTFTAIGQLNRSGQWLLVQRLES
jgi:hypothetical protein